MTDLALKKRCARISEFSNWADISSLTVRNSLIAVFSISSLSLPPISLASLIISPS